VGGGWGGGGGVGGGGYDRGLTGKASFSSERKMGCGTSRQIGRGEPGKVQ